MKKRVAILTVFILSFSLLNAQEEQTILHTPTGDLEGTITIPEQKKDIPVVLIIAGSGPTDRNGNQGEHENNSLKFIAEELSKNGLASLRFDKRGVAKSADAMTQESDMRFEDGVNDVKAWIELLSKDKRFSKIIIAGHSEGSLIGMLAAANNKHVNGFISIAGAGRAIDVILKEQLADVPENVKEIMFAMIDTLKKGDTIANVPPIYYALFRPSVQPYMISWFKYDPQIEIKKLDMPVLLIQGTTDIQVKEADVIALSKAQPKAQLRIIKNMNHVLKDCETSDKKSQIPIYSNPDLPLNKEFVKEMTGFIKHVK